MRRCKLPVVCYAGRSRYDNGQKHGQIRGQTYALSGYFVELVQLTQKKIVYIVDFVYGLHNDYVVLYY